MQRRPLPLRDPVSAAKRAKRESKYIDFKESFDPGDKGEWCELLKDLVAMANTGGGLVVVGLDDRGRNSGKAVKPVVDLDPATITDKFMKYTGENFDGVNVHSTTRGRQVIAILAVDASDSPLVFIKPGTYPSLTGGQSRAFSQGSVYVRHGAKSEPATGLDLRVVLDRKVELAREAWLGNMRKVVEAGPDAMVAVYRPTRGDVADQPQRIQLTSDPDAAVYGRLDPDASHPYRQTEVVKEVNGRLPKGVKINAHDILSVRRTHRIDSNPLFFHQPRFGSPQYSEPFVDWVAEEYARDKEFFASARAHYYADRHG
jgi:Putative DNA-binding domain/EC042_2821-lke REase